MSERWIGMSFRGRWNNWGIKICKRQATSCRRHNHIKKKSHISYVCHKALCQEETTFRTWATRLYARGKYATFICVPQGFMPEENMPRLVRVPRLHARRYATFRTCAKALCQEIYAALCQESVPRFLRVEWYNQRRRKRRGRATYLNLTTCAEKRKKCHVSQNDVWGFMPGEHSTFHTCKALYAQEEEEVPRTYVCQGFMPGRGMRRRATYLTCATLILMNNHTHIDE